MFPVPTAEFSQVIIEPLREPDTSIALLRIAVGSFFAISGFHKLFHKARHATLVKTLQDNHIPFIRFNQWFVPAVEFAGGLAITLGLFTVFSALLLGAICLVATCTDGLARVRSWKPINKADFLDTVLYLPEVVYGLLILAVIFAGPDRFTLDHILQLIR